MAEASAAIRSAGMAHGVSGARTTVRLLVAEVAAILRAGHVPDAEREARDIVAAVLDRPRLWPSVNREAEIDARSSADAHAAAHRRLRGAPFAYAVGRAAFRHLTLAVDERVLIPRQETELLVEALLQRTKSRGGVAADLGTGSGAIALALASEAGFERVIATDVSLGALAVARHNAERLKHVLRAPIEFRHGTWLSPLAATGERVRVLVANPPYVSGGEATELPPSVRDWEPPVALFSGSDGMAATEDIIRGAGEVLEPGGLLAMEIDTRRAGLAAGLALAAGGYRNVSVLLDLAGRERILVATWTGAAC